MFLFQLCIYPACVCLNLTLSQSQQQTLMQKKLHCVLTPAASRQDVTACSRTTLTEGTTYEYIAKPPD